VTLRCSGGGVVVAGGAGDDDAVVDVHVDVDVVVVVVDLAAAEVGPIAFYLGRIDPSERSGTGYC
jgi:hypothetical protein